MTDGKKVGTRIVRMWLIGALTVIGLAATVYMASCLNTTWDDLQSLRITIGKDSRKFNVVSADFSRVGQFLTGTPMRVDSRGNESPWIATSVTPEPGKPENWLVVLRADARFHDNTPISAEDLVASFQAAADKDLAPVYKLFFTD